MKCIREVLLNYITSKPKIIMWNNEQQEDWDDIRNLWNKSSHKKEIKSVTSQLVIESNNWINPFEKDTIKKDLGLIKKSINQDEKESIKKDIIFIKKNINQSESNFLKSSVAFITGVIKNAITLKDKDNQK